MAEGIYRQLSLRQPRAVFNEDTVVDQNSNIRLAQPPTAPLRGRNLALSYLVGGGFLGLLMGMAGVAVATDHVENARWEKLGGDLGQQRGTGRGGVAGLEDNGVAGSESRGELPDSHHHRVVPRSYLCADTDRFAANHGGHPLHVFAC